MERLRTHPLLLTTAAMALATIAVVAIAAAYGFGAFAHAWAHVRPGWLAFSFGAVLLAIPAYALAYRDVLGAGGGPEVPSSLVATLVIAGFAPMWPGGGFALDRRALNAVHHSKREARQRVLGLGALEWALLAPAVLVAAAVLLAVGDHRVLSSLLWPWVIGVPVGALLALGLTLSERAQSLPLLTHACEALAVLELLGAKFRRRWGAWVGMGLYWALDIASLYGAARFIGLRLSIGELVIAYGTGYALTRRSMPLAGAGATEVLLTFSLHWVGEPVPASLAVVIVYRIFNFVVPTLPALFVHPRVKPLLEAK